MNDSIDQQNKLQVPKQAEPQFVSPSKIEEAHRILSKHKRFSFYPKHKGEKYQQSTFNQKKSGPNSTASDGNQQNKKSLFRNKDKNFNNKRPKKFHTKYKYQTFHNQLKKVPRAPNNDNKYLMYNSNIGPMDQSVLLSVNSPRLDLPLDHQQPNSTIKSLHEGQYHGNCTPRLIDSNVYDIGASMNFLVGAETFLDLNLDTPLEELKSDDKSPVFNNGEASVSQSPNKSGKQNNESRARREQMIQEIQQQKLLIRKLLNEISQTDRILKEYESKVNQQNEEGSV